MIGIADRHVHALSIDDDQAGDIFFIPHQL